MRSAIGRARSGLREIDPELDTVEVGEVFGKYELLGRIATGGMAEIFRAASTSIGGFRKILAVKRVLPQLSKNAEFISLFIGEAKLAVTLTHSNIVGVIDFGRVDNSYYLAMELVEGRDMTHVLVKQSKRQRLVPVEVACYVMSQTCRGLHYAHTRTGRDGRALGIVHRDVSPHNVLVSYDGEVRLTDFGISKARSRVSLTKPGLVLGKFAYMSPEQANGLEVDARSDVYAAGVTLYESLTGRRLFYSDDPQRTLQKVRNPQVSPPSSFNPDITPALDDIVMRALAPIADQRYQTARALADDLQSYLQVLAPDFNDSHLARFMKDLFEDEVGAGRFAMAADRPAPRTARISISPTDFEDPVYSALEDQLRAEPNLWTLVQLADRLIDLGRAKDGARALRVASTKFAQNGLLVQAIALQVRLRDLEGPSDQLDGDVAGLKALAGRPNERVRKVLGALGEDSVGRMLACVFDAAEPSGMASVVASPLFSVLGREELVQLVSILDLRKVIAGNAVVQEGDDGGSLFIIARGRVVIYCRNFFEDKVYLTSLSDGDCFGEFSFFTGQRRVASVEALDELLVFEIRRAHFDAILERLPNLTTALLRFYKERVVATLLAKSEVFGVLDTRVRASLAQSLTPERYERGDRIIREGDRCDGFYLVKSGEIEVFRENDGFVFLSKLKSGEFFGEIASIQDAPRSASVRALGPCEVLKLSGSGLQDLASANPKMMDVLRRRIAEREAENARTLTAGGLLI